MAGSVIGRSVPRVDGRPKVTGRADYVGDLKLPGMLHAAVLRSPHPHARLKKVDAGEARRVPGVRAVVTGADLLRMDDVQPRYGPAFKDQPIVAIDKVRHVGEAVAAVAQAAVSGDVILTLGAGDIEAAGAQIVERLPA